MIPASDRTAIDAVIDGVLDRLRTRGAGVGTPAALLADAAGRAATGGKRLRPALVVAAFRAFGGEPDATPAVWTVAAAFELLHSAFVIHDDLIDRDVERRGEPNVAGTFRQRATRLGVDATGAARIGEAASVLAGDLLLFEAARLIATASIEPEARAAILALIEDAVLVSAGGELADVQNAAAPEWPHSADLLDVARDKTAVYTFRAPLAAGAILAGAQPGELHALEDAADQVGLAFQLVDDLIGAFGSREQAGRETGADLREGKRTPVIGLAHDTPTWRRVSAALALAHTGPVAVRRAQRALDTSGARSRAEGLVRDCLRDARTLASAAALPAAAVDLLAQLADSVETRIP